MGKLLLMLTLVAISNLTGTVNSSSDQLKVVSNNKNGPIVDSVLTGFKLPDGHKEFYNRMNTDCLNYLPSDYVVNLDTVVYKLHNESATWNVARKTCMEEGGQLVILNSDEEVEMLLNWMEKENIDISWLGVHDLFGEGDWMTLKGETMETAGYHKWNTVWPNQPDNYGGNENCGVFIRYSINVESSGLGDVPCDWKYDYVCEINLC